MSRLFDIATRDSTDDWYTPAWVFDGLGIRFDIDVCAPPGGVPWIPADRFFTESEDGLAQQWDGFVWCNPPYSDPGPWCRKWAAHSDGLLLIKCDLAASGQRAAFDAAHGIYAPDGRIQFVSGGGKPTGRVNFATVILARGDRAVHAIERLANTVGGSARRLL